MRYGIPGVLDDEVISRYFVREDNILVRYHSGRTELVDFEKRDSLDEIMREQAHLFITDRTEVTREVIGDFTVRLVGGAYIFTILELLIKGMFINSNPLAAGVGFGMWVFGENLYSYIAYETDFTPGRAKSELDMIRKYRMFLKNEERILEYLKENESEFSGKINDLDFVNYGKLKEIVKLSKRKK